VSKDINEEISRCIIKMLLKEPFYAHFLSGIIREVTDKVPTAAVGFKSGKIALYVNENFFLKELRSTERVAVIKHETLHIIFKHLFRMKTKDYDNRLFNIAADLVVNQLISPWKLPDSAVTLETYRELKLPPDKSVEWYYENLKKTASKDKEYKKSLQEIFDKMDASGNGGKGLGGNDLAGDEGSSKKRRYHSDHRMWGENENFSMEVVETEVDRMIIQARDRTPIKDHGTIPLGIQSLIKNIVKKRNPQINWKKALKIFSSTSRKTRVYLTLKRVSKRFGTRPGIKIKRFQKLAVAIDTSGSINIDDFNDFFGEIHSMWRFGAEIDVLECDAEIQKKYSYRGRIPEFIHGGGGTSFDPVFEHIKSNRFERYDGCIYLTDGYAPEPTIKPPCKVFWCITKDGEIGPHLKFGRVVKMK
jgi:predicted metal-dependent peptidase